MVNDETLFESGRVNVITFDRHFEPDEQDKTLKDRLLQSQELSGILNWCLEGLRRFRKDGAIPPSAVVKATKEYELSSNKISMFLSECLEDSKQNVKMKSVYNVYRVWCIEIRYAIEGKTAFFNEIKKRNLFSSTARVNGRTEANVICNKTIKADYLKYLH